MLKLLLFTNPLRAILKAPRKKTAKVRKGSIHETGLLPVWKH